MRLSVDHRTSYRFSEPQSRLTQLLRLSPCDCNDQTTVAWRIDVNCDARLRHGRDGFGNHVTMLYAQGPIDALEIAVTGEVLTTESHGVLRGAPEPLPPALFLRATVLTEADGAIAAAAREVVGEPTPLARLHRWNGLLKDRFKIERGRPIPGTSAASAFGEATVTSRDLAHIFIAGARVLGAPGRYVSGYSLGGTRESTRPTPHGWAEAHVDGIGWVGFDPCAGRSPDESYVRVAAALDATGAAPVAGSRMGAGDEELAAEVHVEQVSGED